MMAIISNRIPIDNASDSLNYKQRCQRLIDHGYAIWDVLASCTRPGSLDNKIVKGSEHPNNIAHLVNLHPELNRIVCNGRTAEKLFNRHIAKTLTRPLYAQTSLDGESTSKAIRLICLPSTSPAMASLSPANKHQVWSEGLLR